MAAVSPGHARMKNRTTTDPAAYRLTWFFAGFVLIVGLAAFLYYRSERQANRRAAYQMLSAVANLKAARIAGWYGERMGDANVIHDSEIIMRNLRAALAESPESGSADQVTAWMDSLRRQYDYDSVRLYDARGVLRLASPPARGGETASEAAALAQALRQQAVDAWDLHRAGTNEPAMLAFFVPVTGGSGAAPNVGALRLQMNAETGVFSLLEKWPTGSRSAETVLLRREGQTALILNNTRSRLHSALNQSLALTQTNYLAVQAVNGLRGPHEGVDYRGVLVLAAVVEVPGTHWIMVCKIDLAEVDAPLRREFWLLLALVCGLVAAAGFAANGLNRAQQLKLAQGALAAHRELADTEARFREIFESSPISIWDEDFSAVKVRFDELRAREGVQDLGVYFETHPEEVRRLAGWVRVVRVNQATLMLLGLEKTDDIQRLLPAYFQEESFEAFRAELVALAEGRQSFHGEAMVQDATGRAQIVEWSLSVPEGYAQSLARVLVSLQDITRRRHYEQEIGRLNRLYAALGEINQCIVRVRSREELFAEVCRATVQFGGFEMAWVGWLDTDTQEVKVAAQHGKVAGYLEHIKVYADHRPEGQGPTGICLREERTYVCDDFFNDPHTALWRDAAAERNYRASVSVPIRFGGRAAGALMVYAAEPGYFGAAEVALMEKAALDISFGLDNLAVEQKRQQAEAGLKDREKLLSTIFNQASDSIAMVDMVTGRFAEFNTATHESLGYTREEFAALPLVEVQVQYSPASLAAQLQTIREHGRLTFENQHRHRDGSLRDVLVRAAWLVIQERDYVLAVWSDITEAKQARKQIEESEARLRLALEVSGQGIFDVVDFETGETFTSPEYARMLGYEPEGFVETTDGWLGRLHPEDRGRAEELFRRYIEGKLPEYKVEFRLRKKDGSWIWIFSTGRIIERDEHGRPRRMLGTHTDINARKQAEEATQRLMVAIDQSVEGIMFTDLKGKVVYINSGYEKTCGYRRDEIIGRTPALFKSGKQPPEFYRNLWRTILQGQVWRGHFINQRKNGTLFEEDATITPIRNTNGEIISFVATKHDLTRVSILERQLIEAQKMEAVGQLAGGVAHDFNNILAASVLNLGIMLVDPDLTPELREGLVELKQGVDRATGLTRQLLTFSRRQTMESRLVELNSLLDNSLKMLRRLLGEQIELSTRLPSTEVWVEADPGMIEQVIMNLCINARDAMPRGGKLAVTLKTVEVDPAVHLHPDARSGRFVCLSVSDTGCGMGPELIDRIFEPFFTTKGVGKGTGLGLATVHGITKQHKGWIEVASEPGRGSEFLVYLPAAVSPAASLARETSSRILRGHETILVVEDEEILRHPLVKLLNSAGYKVLAAENGSDALQRWRDRVKQLDLLITDMVMPGGMTGLELAEALLALKPNLRVILTSGYSQELSLGTKPAHPGVRFLSKPYTPESLGKVIREVLAEAGKGG